jgi:hypothetical protein
MKQIYQKQAAIVAVAVYLLNVAGRALWKYCGFLWSYDLFDAIAWCLVLYFLQRITQNIYRRITAAVYYLAVGNLMDELFFDPTSFGWNEIVFLCMVLGWLFYHIIKSHYNEGR